MTPKFRAWIPKSRKMKIVNRIEIYDKPNEIIVSCDADELSRGNEYVVNEQCSLMQSTGLKDSKGNEIFDGDICSDGCYTFTVMWNICGWYWKQINANADDESSYFSSHRIEGTLEIIGNIHANPSLIGGEK